MNEQTPGRELHAGLDLLDRQIIDCNEEMAGNVDDLEFELPEESDGLPVLVAILSGPGALAGHLGGRLGHWLEALQKRLHHLEDPGPARLAFSLVKKINDHVEVSVPRETLENNRVEEWARKVIIDKIPGAGHAPE